MNFLDQFKVLIFRYDEFSRLGRVLEQNMGSRFGARVAFCNKLILRSILVICHFWILYYKIIYHFYSLVPSWSLKLCLHKELNM